MLEDSGKSKAQILLQSLFKIDATSKVGWQRIFMLGPCKRSESCLEDRDIRNSHSFQQSSMDCK